MLRLNEEGSISLTINGVVIGSLSAESSDVFSAKDLVVWENIVRLSYYNRKKGFWCTENQIEHRRNSLFDGGFLETEKEHSEYWEKKRLEAIDN